MLNMLHVECAARYRQHIESQIYRMIINYLYTFKIVFQRVRYSQ